MELLFPENRQFVLPEFNNDLPPQLAMEDFIEKAVALGRYEHAFLLSEDGLLMAGDHSDDRAMQDLLIELTGFLREVKKMAEMVGGIHQLKEIVIEGDNSKKIIFRFFSAFQQVVALAAVIPEKQSYRSVTNKLIRSVDKISTD